MAATAKSKYEDPRVLRTPFWIVLIRGVIAFLCLGLIGLAGVLIHYAYLNEWGLNVAMALFTWIALAYVVFSEKIPSLRSTYHIIALLTCDAVMIILWLSTFAATAAKRAEFTQSVTVEDCYNNGDVSNSEHCFTTRAVILFNSGLIIFAVMAAVGALNWILFIVCFVWEFMAFRKGRKEGRFRRGGPFNSAPRRHTGEDYQMKPKANESFLAQSPGQNRQPRNPELPGSITQYQQSRVFELAGSNSQYQQPQGTGLTGSAAQNHRLSSPEVAGSMVQAQHPHGSELTESTTYYQPHPNSELPGSAAYTYSGSYNASDNYTTGQIPASFSNYDRSLHGGDGGASHSSHAAYNSAHPNV